MFTRGFKLFFGIAGAALLAALVFGMFTNDVSGPNYLGVVDRETLKGVISLGWRGGIGEPIGYIVLLMLATTAAFLGITLNAFRDADPEAVAELSATGELAPGEAPTAPSWWPLAGAIGVGCLIVGFATSTAIWALGLVIIAVVAFEWAMSAWADRATGDAATNTRLRRTVMGPIEIPVLSLAGVAVVALAASRMFLTVSKAWAVWLAMILAILILGLGALLASRPRLAKSAVAAMVGGLAVLVIGGGIASAAAGARDIHHHEPHGADHSSDGESHSEDGQVEDGHSEDGESHSEDESHSEG